jgi:hypothetical protein
VKRRWGEKKGRKKFRNDDDATFCAPAGAGGGGQERRGVRERSAKLEGDSAARMEGGFVDYRKMRIIKCVW